MTKTNAAFARTGLYAWCALVLALCAACATSFRSREEILQSSRAVQLKMVGGLENPGIRVIAVDEQGFVHVEDRFPGKTSEEMLTRLNKPDSHQIFALVDSLEAVGLKTEYQIGEDSKTYTLILYRDGKPTQSSRFSSGIPQTVRQLLQQLEKIPDDE